MSYYFCIIGTRDNPLFELEFGTSKQGGDGIARFPEQARQLNPFIVHSSLDIVEELQWQNSAMYLKRIDQFSSSHISAFLTPDLIKFLILHLPHPPNTPPVSITTANTFAPFAPYTSTQPTSSARSSSSSSSSNTSIANNPTSPQTEEAIRQFFMEVFEAWLKCVMNPFYGINDEIKSPIFRGRVIAAGKKYL